MANNNVSTLANVLKQLADRQAAETAHAIRAFLGGILGSATVAPSAPALPVAVAPRRKPGRPKKAVAVAAPPTTKPAKGRRSSTFSESDLARVMASISAKPGQRPDFYRRESKLAPKAFANLLKKLKGDGSVRAMGRGGRGTTYVAGAAAATPAAVKPAAPKASKPVAAAAPKRKPGLPKKIVAAAAPAPKAAPVAKKVPANKANKANKAPAKKAPRKLNPAFMRALQPSAALAKIVGDAPLPRTEAVKKVWVYIKKHGLQDKKNKRNINADDALLKVFGGTRTISMFEMTKLLSKNLS